MVQRAWAAPIEDDKDLDLGFWRAALILCLFVLVLFLLADVVDAGLHSKSLLGICFPIQNDSSLFIDAHWDSSQRPAGIEQQTNNCLGLGSDSTLCLSR